MYTFSEELISDLHKDAYGFRPGESFYEKWKNSTDAQKQETWDLLTEVMEEEMNIESQREKEAVEDLWKLVKKTIDEGAGTQENAIRWIVQGVGCEDEYDLEYICYQLGLPYNMAKIFKK